MLAGRRRASNSRPLVFARALALGITGCLMGCADEPEPCGEGQVVDVHFAYATAEARDGAAIETRECMPVFVGLASNGAGLIVLDCGAAVWEVDVEGVTRLELGDAGELVTARSQVAEPGSLPCGERGWLAVEDAEGRLRLLVAALQSETESELDTETVLELGELGPVTLIEDTRGDCPGLTLRTTSLVGATEVWVPAAATTPIELGGVAFVLELGQAGASSCRTDGYDLLLRRVVE